MTDKFGSPNAGDATAKREKRIAEAVRRRVARLERGDLVINRPIGSIVDLPLEDRIADWQSQIANPQELLDKIGQRAIAVGPKKAALEALKWDAELRKASE